MLGPGVAYLRWLRNRGVTMRRVLEAARADDGAMSFAACRDAEPIASRDAANSNVRRRVTFFFTRGHHKSDAPVQFVPVFEPAGLPPGPPARRPGRPGSLVGHGGRRWRGAPFEFSSRRAERRRACFFLAEERTARRSRRGGAWQTLTGPDNGRRPWWRCRRARLNRTESNPASHENSPTDGHVRLRCVRGAL